MQKLVTLVIASTNSFNKQLHMESIQASVNNAALTDDLVRILARRLISPDGEFIIEISNNNKLGNVFHRDDGIISRLKVMVVEPIVAAELA